MTFVWEYVKVLEMPKLQMRIHHPVSTAVEAVGYNRQARALAVRYHGGRDYLFLGVHPHRFTALRKAASVGAFVQSTIVPRHECFTMESA